MSGGAIIRVDMGAGGWAAVPRAPLDNDLLSLQARGLLAWFLTRGDGFEVRVESCRRKFGLGRHAWSTLAGQLVAAGHYHRETARGEDGRIRTLVFITALPRLTDVGFPDIGTDVGLADTRCTRQSGQPHVGEPVTVLEKRTTREKTTTTVPPPVGAVGGGGLVFQGKEPPASLLQILEGSSVREIEWQLLLDELEGAVAAGLGSGKPVRSPVGYLRRLACLQARQALICEHAEGVAQRRRDRAAVAQLAARQVAAALASPRPPKPEIPQLPSQARLDAQAKLRELKSSFKSFTK